MEACLHWTPSVSSEQAAAPDTPRLSTHPRYPSSPRLPIRRQHPSRVHASARAHTTPRASRTTFRPGEWCTRAPPPPRLAPSLRASGAFAEDPDEAGGVTTAECGALAPTRRPQRHSVDTRGWRPQMQTPPTPARSQRQSVSHHGGTAHPSQVGVHRCFTSFTPPPLSTDQVPANAAGYSITHAARPVAQEFSQTGSVDAHAEEARVAANTGLAHWEATKQALQHTLLARAAYVSRAPRQAAHWRADPDAAGNIAEIRRAIFGYAFPIDGGTTPLIFEAAAHHWKWQCRSQPRAPPLGGSQAVTPLLPRHTRPTFRTHGDQQPTEGLSKCDGSMAVDWRATSGRASPIIESDHIAPTHGGKEASRRRSPVSAPFWQSHHPVFQALQRPSRPRASGATAQKYSM